MGGGGEDPSHSLRSVCITVPMMGVHSACPGGLLQRVGSELRLAVNGEGSCQGRWLSQDHSRSDWSLSTEGSKDDAQDTTTVSLRPCMVTQADAPGSLLLVGPGAGWAGAECEAAVPRLFQFAGGRDGYVMLPWG